MTARYFVLIGAPGSGKGTQATPLASALGIVHISSGDLFRDNIRRETPLGNQAKQFLDAGELVPDELTIDMVLDRMRQPDAAGGAILDGFPRTDVQARKLDDALAANGAAITRAIYLMVPDDVLLSRLSGRWLCPTCGASYHTEFNPPKHDSVCDNEGAALYQRTDDNPETARKRLDGQWYGSAAKMVDYYAAQDKLIEVNGVGAIDQVSADLLAAANR